MTDNIKKIFNTNIKMIKNIDRIIYYFRVQNYDRALRQMTSTIEMINVTMELILVDIEYIDKNIYEVEAGSVVNILNGLLRAQEVRDYIYLADLLELHIIPLSIGIQEGILSQFGLSFNEELYLANIDVINKRQVNFIPFLKPLAETSTLLGNGYSIDPTSSGLPTLAIDNNKERYYLHSNNRIENEAFTLARSWYSLDKDEYVIYGLGLGYHINELIEIDKNVTINVYESDINVINLACMFGNVKGILGNENVNIYYDPKFELLSEKLADTKDNIEFAIHYPSLRNVKNIRMKEQLESYFIQQSSVANQIHLLNNNFRYNIMNFDSIVDTLSNEFKDKDLYIVAAGPSLDKNIKDLKKVGEEGVILATGTVFRKLMNEGIRPDYLIVSDANERVLAQISGYESSDVPMIFLSTSYHGFAKNYKGKKYIVLQKGYEKSESFAKEKSCYTYDTGGSVSTLALDIGIRLAAKRIIFIGLDLAYTDDYVHASGTSRRILEDKCNLVNVEDVHGKTVNTTKVLNIYRQWIEKRISNIKNIEIIDATEGGAKIKGMKRGKLIDFIVRGDM